ncbi:MAG: hypothetical protein GY865_00565 [candidate division Zixibacteria bacterium]|nr:hypothetical protein [candidate division Zixibacteria bacterium]
MRIVTIILFVLLLSMSIYAYDIEGGRQAGMAGTIILSKPSAYGSLNCPATNLLPNQFIIETVGNRKFGLADLDQAAILAAYRFNNISVAFGFSRMGTPDYYTEKNIRTVLSYHKRSITASLISSGRLVEIGRTYGKLQAASAGLGLSYFKDNYYFGITIDDINKPNIVKYDDDDDDDDNAENVKINLFAEIDGKGKHSVTGRVVFEKYEKPHISLAQFINLTETNGLFWGLSFNPLKYGGGFEIEYNKFSICYGLSHHPVLGFSHNISLSFLTGRTNKID